MNSLSAAAQKQQPKEATRLSFAWPTNTQSRCVGNCEMDIMMGPEPVGEWLTFSDAPNEVLEEMVMVRFVYGQRRSPEFISGKNAIF